VFILEKIFFSRISKPISIKPGTNHPKSFLIKWKFKFVQIIILGVVGATMGKIIFTCVYIGKKTFEFFLLQN
jgi:hypothetical protein